MSLAIAYAMKKRKAKKHMEEGCEAKYAEGGEVDKKTPYSAFSQGVKNAFDPPAKADSSPKPTPPPEEHDENPTSQGMKKAFNVPGYDKGGLVEEEKASGYQDEPEDMAGDEYPAPQKNRYMEEHDEDEDYDDDMISKIMMSRGGMVANKDQMLADFEDNEFDDLVKDDHLEAHYPGSDEISDHEEDEDRRDIVRRIMKSRAKKDRNPRLT